MLKICFKIAIVAFILILIFTLVVALFNRCSNKNTVEDMEENTVVLRYYLGDGEDAVLHYQRVEKGKPFKLDVMPSEQGKIFAGLYSSSEWSVAQLYVDSDGNSVITINADTVLYPVFN